MNDVEKFEEDFYLTVKSPISGYLHNNFIFSVYACIIFQSWSKSSILEPSEHENCNFYTPGGLTLPPSELTGKS